MVMLQPTNAPNIYLLKHNKMRAFRVNELTQRVLFFFFRYYLFFLWKKINTRNTIKISDGPLRLNTSPSAASMAITSCKLMAQLIDATHFSKSVGSSICVYRQIVNCVWLPFCGNTSKGHSGYQESFSNYFIITM